MYFYGPELKTPCSYSIDMFLRNNAGNTKIAMTKQVLASLTKETIENLLIKKCEKDLWAMEEDGVTVKRLFSSDDEPIK